MKKFITAYQGRNIKQVDQKGEISRTKQSFKEECDVNNIMRKYFRTGQLPELARREPKYGDFASVPDYQEALNTVLRAETIFQALPSSVRAECQNDPAVFLERVKDPEWALKHKLALPRQTIPQDATKGILEAANAAAATQPGASSTHSEKAKKSSKTE